MKTEKIKDTPLRTCIVCKQLLPKKDMLRIVKTKDGVAIDYTNKANGRGAYICNNENCITTCVNKKLLNKTFKMALSEEIYNKILEDYGRKG